MGNNSGSTERHVRSETSGKGKASPQVPRVMYVSGGKKRMMLASEVPAPRQDTPEPGNTVTN
jgi:hypothetical protein